MYPKKLLAFVVAFVFLSACSTKQKINKEVSEGNYDAALELAYNDLKQNKNNDDLVNRFKQVFDKANIRDLDEIRRLKSSSQTLDNFKKIYALYEKLDARQYQVMTIQPLHHKGNEVNFNLKDYGQEVKISKNNYANHLYQSAQSKLVTGQKQRAREAYKLLQDLQFIDPTYHSNLNQMIENAKVKGSSLILLNVNNTISNKTTQTDIKELTRISEANMNNPWLVFHDKKDYSRNYDYQLNINLDKLNISPEQQNSEVIPQQKRIATGWEYVYDSNGNVMKDKDGNDMKRQKVANVQAEIRLVQQLKKGNITGHVAVKNLRTNAVTSQTPINGETTFENVYGQYRGDQRAIEEKYYQALQNKAKAYPPDSLFVRYALKDFKAKLQQYLNTQQFNK